MKNIGKNIDNIKYVSDTIGVLRFPLMVCVVLIHIRISYQTNHFFVNVFSNYVTESFVCIAVPLFFFISGFLFFFRVKKFGVLEYNRKLINRVRRLLIPYMVWGVVAIGIKYIFYLLGQDDAVYLFDGCFNWIYYVVWDPFNYPLWFVRDLFIVVVMSPIIYFLLKYLNVLFLFLLGILWLFWHDNIFAIFEVQYYMFGKDILNVFGFDFVSLFFFSFGAWFAIFDRDFTLDFREIFPIAFVLYIIFTIGKFVWQDTYVAELFNRFSIFGGLISVVTIVHMLVKAGKIKRNVFLEYSSQFIYYYHVIFITYYAMFLFHLNLLQTDNSFIYSLLYLSVPIIAILLGLLLFRLGMRYVPRVMEIILGINKFNN